MQEEEIYLVPYDPTWPEKFEKEKILIQKILGDWIHGGVHHVGSTAVPGLSAKPIIDIMVGVKDLEKAKACIPLLAGIEYQHFPYRPNIMIWFCKPSPYKRTHHVYLMEPSTDEWNARLLFRNYLRKNEKARNAYEQLKIQLAEKFRNDREAYTEAKTDFVASTTAKALKYFNR